MDHQTRRSARVGLEATGVYSLEVALAGSPSPHRGDGRQSQGDQNYAGARLQRAKTDLVDARLILDFVQRMNFVPWKPPLDEMLQLQAITRLMNQLKLEATQQANHPHAEGCPPTLPD